VADHFVGGLHCAEVEDLAASFVLDALETHEADTVRTHLAGCPEAHPAFAELGSVVPALLEAVDLVEPAASLKGRILDAAGADTQRAAETQPAAGAPRAAEMPRAQAPRALDTQRAADPGRGTWASFFRRPVWAGVAMAAVVAAVALGAWNVALRGENDSLVAYRNAVAAVLDQARQPGAQLAVLGPTAGGGGPSGFAAVGQDGAVSIVMRDLTPTAGAEVYEAWLITGENAPVPIGGFTVSPNGTASFVSAQPSVGTGVTIALTLEPGPGATTPTLPIIAVGAAHSAT
jgi:hypothetical protein